MSDFDEAVIQRIKQLEREVERLQRWERPIGGGGVTDHGALTGLGDDDHTQYLNTTRHDTTTRHMLGTVVPHDDHGQLTGLTDDDHTQYTKHPASSTDNAIARWDGTGGRTIQNSGVTIDDSNNIKVGTAPVPTSVTSSTDNAVVRFDSTGGNKIQNSGVIINDSGQLSGNGLDGWIYDTDTWTYVSATSFKITGKDVRYKFPKGTKIKLVQSGITKYFYVVATAFSTDTTVTITGGSDYTLAEAAISGQAYSYAAAPQGYPFGTVAIRVERSTNQSIPNGTWTALSFDTIITEEKPATTSQWSSGDPTQLICRLPGYYLINAHVRLAANATGGRGINLVKNGSTALVGNVYAAFSGIDAHIQCSAIVKLDTGDYIEAKAYQNSGAALDAVATSSNLHFEWIRLGI